MTGFRWEGRCRKAMNFGFAVVAFGLAGFGVGSVAGAQQLPPPEPAQPLPRTQDSTVLRSTTNVVLVPTLVEKDHGQVVYGLKAADFVVEDNGVQQKLHV